jgi:hypothetical protein
MRGEVPFYTFEGRRTEIFAGSLGWTVYLVDLEEKFFVFFSGIRKNSKEKR